MLKVVFEDNCLLVLDKPAGLVVTSSQTQKEETLEDILRSKFGLSLERGGIVHRLDKDTSGLLVVGKNQEAVLNLQAQFKSRTVKKKYLVLVHGFIMEPGKIATPIIRNPKNREKFIAKEDLEEGKEAVTEYEPAGQLTIDNRQLKIIFPDFNKIQMRKLERQHYGEFTLLLCQPKTGRTHQIRVHLKYIGHPVVGDGKYAGRKMARLDRRWCPRQFLHAERLEFTHPVSGKRLNFESQLPLDLEQTLEKLR